MSDLTLRPTSNARDALESQGAQSDVTINGTRRVTDCMELELPAQRLGAPRAAFCALLAALLVAAIITSSCGGQGPATWDVVAEFERLRVEASNPAGPAMSPAFALRSGAVRVVGEVTYDAAGDTCFGVGLAPTEMTRPALAIETRHHAVDAARVEEFEGVLENVEAGEYRLYLLGTSSTCDVTVFQRR